MPSAIDPNFITVAPVSKSGMRDQLTIAKNEITALQDGKFDKAGGNLTGNVGVTKSNPQLRVDKSGNLQTASVVGLTAAVPRWSLDLGDDVSETGANVGSNFRLVRYSDAGAVLDITLLINRGTGAIAVASPDLWRAGLSAAPLPTGASVPGLWSPISIGASTSFVLPAGGTWAWHTVLYVSGAFSTANAGVSAGGTTIAVTGGGEAVSGFIWRLT